MTRSEKAKEVIARLHKLWPKPTTALIHKNAFELLIATIMSAQTTDKLVNTLTPALFKQYPTPQAMANAPIEEITKYISKVNFANNKAKNIKAASQIIVEKHHGTVPDTMEELDALPGVARKTANVVLGNAYGKAEGVVVDTHVMRLSQKLGLTTHKDPVKIEQDLMQVVPREHWIDFSHLLINFGREYCPARKPSCADTPLGDLFID